MRADGWLRVVCSCCYVPRTHTAGSGRLTRFRLMVCVIVLVTLTRSIAGRARTRQRDLLELQSSEALFCPPHRLFQPKARRPGLAQYNRPLYLPCRATPMFMSCSRACPSDHRPTRRLREARSHRVVRLHAVKVPNRLITTSETPAQVSGHPESYRRQR